MKKVSDEHPEDAELLAEELLRTGSITWQLNRGLTIEEVSAPINASPAIIREFYDAADDFERFEDRRADELQDGNRAVRVRNAVTRKSNCREKPTSYPC